MHSFSGFRMLPDPAPIGGTVVTTTTARAVSDDTAGRRVLTHQLLSQLQRSCARFVTDSAAAAASATPITASTSTNATQQFQSDVLCTLDALLALQNHDDCAWSDSSSTTSQMCSFVLDDLLILSDDDAANFTDAAAVSECLQGVLETMKDEGTIGGYTIDSEKQQQQQASAPCDDGTPRTQVRITVIPPDHKSSDYYRHAYSIQQYHLRDDSVRILTRERTPPHADGSRHRHRIVSLQELVSHHTQQVDNTGNICVWDSERTLAWALLHQQRHDDRTETHGDNIQRSVLELGAGMAALAAFCVKDATTVYITDGHSDCVYNNQVNVRLMRAAGILDCDEQEQQSPRVECRRLLWSAEPASCVERMEADCTLVSDCTHFHEFHAELFWTAVLHTAVRGEIWMCQPNRSGTLQRFLKLVEAVNVQNSCDAALLGIEERLYKELDDKHDKFVLESSSYNPNLHRPRIFVLTKLRPESEDDRLAAVRFIHETPFK
jgi:predicted nicotinamide N-methyase